MQPGISSSPACFGSAGFDEIDREQRILALGRDGVAARAVEANAAQLLGLRQEELRRPERRDRRGARNGEGLDLRVDLTVRTAPAIAELADDAEHARVLVHLPAAVDLPRDDDVGALRQLPARVTDVDDLDDGVRLLIALRSSSIRDRRCRDACSSH